MQSVGFFWFPMTSIASFWSQFQDGLSASERVFALMDREPKVQQIANEPVGPRVANDELGMTNDELRMTDGDVAPPTYGEIEFRHMNFSYNDREVVLPDFSLHIAPGETVALVGHTGAGKSSVGKLITRFYEYQGGELLIDGRDVRRLNLGQYRLQIGGVPQEPFLFGGSVADNIKYGRPEATPDDVRRAANAISGGDWIAALPNGLDTDVGERGGSLSMGQRQLVALARVVLKDPAIFILDEATASVDPFTEAQIQEGLEDIMRERTAIVIAHRLFTVRHADRIIVMKDGRIIEQGQHDALIAAGGHYAELYNTYFRHQSLEYIDNWRAAVEAES
jgi:ABC-type multidrug transport system fused ATPase/permease subunit